MPKLCNRVTVTYNVREREKFVTGITHLVAPQLQISSHAANGLQKKEGLIDRRYVAISLAPAEAITSDRRQRPRVVRSLVQVFELVLPLSLFVSSRVDRVYVLKRKESSAFKTLKIANIARLFVYCKYGLWLFKHELSRSIRQVNIEENSLSTY